ncbi:hypothetical protein DPMN_065876 [Dreissena polymorpha]|uniref:Uncharacterized protein n=1 Tax=Dreissena polymorpha TaxID=45954 RepID=A0A9D4BSE2_DREPO|nr:hypothetical protein DPMN_065876 [Dreissena polymorpha]
MSHNIHTFEWCGLSFANVFEGCPLQRAAALFFSIHFLCPADLKDLPEKSGDEDLDFLDGGSAGLCSI